MRMHKSYRYIANDERFDIKSDSSKDSQLHTEKLADDKDDAYKPQAYRTKLNSHDKNVVILKNSAKSRLMIIFQ